MPWSAAGVEGRKTNKYGEQCRGVAKDEEYLVRVKGGARKVVRSHEYRKPLEGAVRGKEAAKQEASEAPPLR